jgi:dienelactone hydrolase
MTALKGEGRLSILYASTRLPIGGERSAYIARPDSGGAHPVIVVSAPVITAHVKAVCRRLARYGFSVICPDPGEGSGWAGIRDAVATAAAPRAAWADGGRIGLLGIGGGARAAAAAAPSIGRLRGIVLVAPPLEEHVLAGLGEPRASALVIAAAGGEPVDGARAAAPGAAWVVYRDATMGFADETAPEYDAAAAEDCWRRVTGFFETHLGSPPATGS